MLNSPLSAGHRGAEYWTKVPGHLGITRVTQLTQVPQEKGDPL
jgi:hypothetical protein